MTNEIWVIGHLIIIFLKNMENNWKWGFWGHFDMGLYFIRGRCFFDVGDVF